MLFLVQAGFIPLAYFKFIKIYINNLTPKVVNPKLDSLLRYIVFAILNFLPALSTAV